MTTNQLLTPIPFAIDPAMCYLTSLWEALETMEFE
jgi:hypothetical protein